MWISIINFIWISINLLHTNGDRWNKMVTDHRRSIRLDFVFNVISVQWFIGLFSECDCCWHIFIDWHGGGGGGWWRCFQQISIHSCYSISYKRNNPINSNEHFGKLEFHRRSMRSFDLIYCDTAGVAAIRLYDICIYLWCMNRVFFTWFSTLCLIWNR